MLFNLSKNSYPFKELYHLHSRVSEYTDAWKRALNVGSWEYSQNTTSKDPLIQLSLFNIWCGGLKNIGWGGIANHFFQNVLILLKSWALYELHVWKVTTMIKFENTTFRMLVTQTIAVSIYNFCSLIIFSFRSEITKQKTKIMFPAGSSYVVVSRI